MIMKIFIYSCRNFFPLLLILFCLAGYSQKDTLIKRIPADSSKQKLNMDAIYNRPFLTTGKLPVAVGGYLEANTQYASTNGVSDGF